MKWYQIIFTTGQAMVRSYEKIEMMGTSVVCFKSKPKGNILVAGEQWEEIARWWGIAGIEEIDEPKVVGAMPGELLH